MRRQPAAPIAVKSPEDKRKKNLIVQELNHSRKAEGLQRIAGKAAQKCMDITTFLLYICSTFFYVEIRVSL